MSAAVSIDTFLNAVDEALTHDMTDAELRAESERHGHFEEPGSCDACGGVGEHRRGCFEVAAELAWERGAEEGR